MSKEIKASDVEFELAALGELPKAGPEADEVDAGDVRGLAHEGVAHVVHAVLLQPEAVLLVLPLDKKLDVLPNATITREMNIFIVVVVFYLFFTTWKASQRKPWIRLR